MKRFFSLTFILCFCCTYLCAQNINVTSFDCDEKDLTANLQGTTVLDQNGNKCALIRIQTTQKGFTFDVGSLGVQQIVSDKVGEVWVYVPAGVRRMTIRHQQLGSLSDYNFPIQVQSGKTYRMQLVTAQVQTIVQNASTQQYVLFKVTPPNAIVEFDGDVLEVADGTATKRKAFGTYTYSVQAPLYHTQSGSVTVNDPQNKHRVEVALQPAYGFIEVPGDGNLQGAKVFINNEYKGTAPYRSERMASGSYHVRLLQNLYAPLQQEVTVTDNQTTRFAPSLSADYATLTLLVENDADIWVNDELKGKNRWTGLLASGDYRVESRKARHRTSVRELSVTPGMEGQTIRLEAPTPIYGALDISSTPADADIYIDNTKVGTTPMLIPQYLIGDHSLRIVKANHADYTRQFKLSEGESLEIQATLPSGREVVVKTIEGATIYIDGQAVATTKYQGMLSYGKHTLAMENNGKKSNQTDIEVPLQGTDVLSFEIGISFMETVKGVRFNMNLVQGGTFTMGNNHSGIGEKPAHAVSLTDYYIGETEVTEALWKAVMGKLPSGYGQGDNYPVTGVSWKDCQKFIHRLNQLTGKQYRLPTEAQWEFAARGGNLSRRTEYSGSSDINEVAWYSNNSALKKNPVATKKPNELGIYDMTGNALEWCQDVYGIYPSEQQYDPTGPTHGSDHVIRGGSYLNSSSLSTVTCRNLSESVYDWIGFRLALKKE